MDIVTTHTVICGETGRQVVLAFVQSEGPDYTAQREKSFELRVRHLAIQWAFAGRVAGAGNPGNAMQTVRVTRTTLHLLTRRHHGPSGRFGTGARPGSGTLGYYCCRVCQWLARHELDPGIVPMAGGESLVPSRREIKFVNSILPPSSSECCIFFLETGSSLSAFGTCALPLEVDHHGSQCHCQGGFHHRAYLW